MKMEGRRPESVEVFAFPDFRAVKMQNQVPLKNFTILSPKMAQKEGQGVPECTPKLILLGNERVAQAENLENENHGSACGKKLEKYALRMEFIPELSENRGQRRSLAREKTRFYCSETIDFKILVLLPSRNRKMLELSGTRNFSLNFYAHL